MLLTDNKETAIIASTEQKKLAHDLIVGNIYDFAI
jgi:hypothetical protein